MFSLSYMLVNMIGLSISLLLLWKIGQRTGDWLTYAHLFSILWGANLIISQRAMGELLKPEIPTLEILYCAWWAFLIGTLFVIRKPVIRRHLSIRINQARAVTILIILVALQLVAYLYEMVSIGINPVSLITNFFTVGSELRLTDIYSTIRYPFSVSIWRWGHVLYIPLALLLHHKKMISTRVLTFVFMLAFVLSWVKFTRAPFIQLVLVSFISWIVIYTPDAKIRNIVGLSLATFVLVGFVVTQRTLTERTDPYAKIAPTDNLFSYIGASPMAYETLIKGYFPRAETGYYSLESINFVLFKLSIIGNYPGLSRPYAAMPFETNVYTFLDVFTLDGGVPLAILGSFVIGAAVAWVYKRMCFMPDYANLTIYCFLAYCCAMAIANNEFIRIAVPINIFLSQIIRLIITSRHGNTRQYSQTILSG